LGDELGISISRRLELNLEIYRLLHRLLLI